MRDRNPPDTRAVQIVAADEPLRGGDRLGVESVFVEQLGGRSYEIGVHPPCPIEEETKRVRDRFRAAQQVLERACLCTWGMASLPRLFELLRIAEEHERSS